MPNEARILYWDSCMFLDYINNNPDHADVIEAVFQEVRDTKGSKILTSVMAKVEVAYASYEKTKRTLDQQIEDRIDSIWQDSSVVELIEFNDDIAIMARTLMRGAILQGWDLKSKDAVHLASAQWVRIVTEFHTYDAQLHKYGSLIGRKVCDPYILQPRLLGER